MPARKRARPRRDLRQRHRVRLRRSVIAASSMADEVLAFRNDALAKRARALRRVERAARPAAALVPAPLLAGVGPAGSAGVLIAEGDSWFDYPLHDVVRLLEDEHAYDVQSVAHRGDRLESMAYSMGQFEQFTRALEKLIRDGEIPNAILLSGGGDDIAGDTFDVFLNHARSVHAGLSNAVVTGVIDERLQDAYTFALAAYTQLSRERTGRAIPIIIHGYDYPVADGRGFLGGWGPLPGPWLEPGFREKGFEDVHRNTATVAVLIDRFNAMLRRIATASEFAHVHYLDLRGTLSTGPGYRTWWANEIHPTERGFAKIADLFAALIASL